MKPNENVDDSIFGAGFCPAWVFHVMSNYFMEQLLRPSHTEAITKTIRKENLFYWLNECVRILRRAIQPIECVLFAS